MSDALVQIVLENLSSLIQKEIGLIWGVNDEMEKLRSTLSTIQSVIEDAEQKRLREDKAIKDWLRKLNSVAYEVDDILDDFVTEANRGDSRLGKRVWLPSLSSCFPLPSIQFRCKIGNRMREIRERLDEIAEERTKFHLREMVVEKRVGLSEIRQTGSVLTEPQVYGRDGDREKIIEGLINGVGGCKDVSVYPIIGMGGLGKTTLAQLVFNDERVAKHFELRIWVCVSDDFDVKRILKAIIESATNNTCEVLALDPLQRRLQEMLNGKRYLLVLDDVWNDNQEKWERLKGILECGSRGTSIVATTRLAKVASIMGTLPKAHRLRGLSVDDCWLLFKQRAFGSQREEHPNLVVIGKEIVKKCGGVPLAAKALGSLMRFKREEKEWVFVRDSEIWNLPQDDETSILPALRLSYYNLPLESRRCFSFCAMFEKDTRIGKENLIHLWMANGFISSSNEHMEMEDIGNEIWNELYWRSFFEDLKEFGEMETFRMHDLVHDLAQSVMEEECQIVDVERRSNMSSKRIRYLNLIARSKPLTSIPKELQNVNSLRTLLYIEKKQDMDQTISSSEFSIFENCGALRAFAATSTVFFESTSIAKVASSIGSLRHLRYLRLCGEGITKLPDSICTLWNLQTLNLYGCYKLQRLPEKMRCLRNLRHLVLANCSSLIEMPPSSGDLTCLKVLSHFIVGKRRGCGIDELRSLNHLGRQLRIKNLEKVGNWMDAKEANLIAKQNLHSLGLSWGRDGSQGNNVKQLLEALQPHHNLRQLVIFAYKGTHFLLWMSDYSNLKSIVHLKLLECGNCTKLPPLHQLPSLRKLSIRGMNYVEYLINNDNNTEVEGRNNAAGGFPCLEELDITTLPNLKGLLSEEKWEGRRPLFPHLHRITIRECPKLTILPCLPMLEEFKLEWDEELTALPDYFGNLTSLLSLHIRGCANLVSIPASIQSLTKLQVLGIARCPKLKMRYEKERGEDWYKIAHVPNVYFD